MGIALPEEVKALIDARNFAHIATVLPDGSPHSVPVWIGREGERLIICTGAGSVKASNTLREPRVAISIVDLQDPYPGAAARPRGGEAT